LIKKVDRACEFTLKVKKQAYDLVSGCCELCGETLAFDNAEFHHKVPLYLGGDCSLENCMVLCYMCHRGSEENYKRLHPNSPPRLAFVPGRNKVRKIAIALKRSRVK